MGYKTSLKDKNKFKLKRIKFSLIGFKEPLKVFFVNEWKQKRHISLVRF